MRKTTGYAGRYLFPCPFSARLSPLFSSALVTSFPSPPRTVISFFLRPDQLHSFLSGNRRFFPSLSKTFSYPSPFSTAPLYLSTAHFYHTFSPPHRIPPACTIFAFPLSFLCSRHIFTAFPSPVVIPPFRSLYLPLFLFRFP